MARSLLLAAAFSSGCALLLGLEPPREDDLALCADTLDNDGDQQVDCADPDCGASCAALLCGNNVIDPGEECDDTNGQSGDGCDVNCTLTACGNGVATAGEFCDDGNLIDGDGCDSNCKVTACGNGIASPGEFCFSDPLITLQGELNDADVGDLDGDGLLEQVSLVSTPTDDLLIISPLNDEGGLRATPTTLPLVMPDPARFFPLFLALVDFSRDEKPEVAIFSASDDFNEGHFQARTIEGFADVTQSDLAIGPVFLGTVREPRFPDFDQDGDPDVVLIGESLVELKRNDGGTGITFTSLFDGGRGYGDVIVEDFNQDGILDLGLTGTTDGSIAFSAHTGDGFYDGEGSQGIFAAAPDLRRAIAGDFDLDGLPDIAAASFDEFNLGLTSSGQIGFPANQQPLSGSNLAQLLAADLDNDGDLDLVYSDIPNNGGELRVLRNDSGTFLDKPLLDIPGLKRVQVRDVNRDGRLDLVIVRGSVVELRLQTP